METSDFNNGRGGSIEEEETALDNYYFSHIFTGPAIGDFYGTRISWHS